MLYKSCHRNSRWFNSFKPLQQLNLTRVENALNGASSNALCRASNISFKYI